MSYEYLVVPAPRLAPRVKGVRSAPERFALAVAEVMNEAGRDGWEYLRTDTLPMEARVGWFGGRTVTPQELLVFRRPLPAPEAEEDDDDDDAPRLRTPTFSHAARGRNGADARGAADPGAVGRRDGEGAQDGPHRLRLQDEPAPVRPTPPSPVPLRPQAEHRVGRSPFDPARAEVEPPAPRPDPGGPGVGRPRLGGARRD